MRGFFLPRYRPFWQPHLIFSRLTLRLLINSYLLHLFCKSAIRDNDCLIQAIKPASYTVNPSADGGK
ncbi:hypothetical protein BG55_14995 [Erwinia mallotivora]|uniref:Uncharacterized protein n=1 Tax=Erwinia mallotivora TaxID=69222 RepID=A0A014LZM8_9GAMM|nr:hypothetical protein BG55_14995 [Erwinia mallotivora]